MTTSVSAIVSAGQASGPHTLRKPLVGPHPPDIGLIGIQRSRDAIEHSYTAKDAKQILYAHASVAALQADESVARDARSVSQLSLCETT